MSQQIINIPELENYKCPICFILLYEPMQSTPCGHLVCENCVVQMTNKCPICRTECTYFLDSRVKREIQNTLISCPFCQDKIIFVDILIHLKNNCTKNMIECKFCKAPYAIKDIKTHYKYCPEVVTSCPDCETFIKTSLLEIHRKNYCWNSQKTECAFCSEKVPITRFQTHYESHINRQKTIFPKLPEYFFS